MLKQAIVRAATEADEDTVVEEEDELDEDDEPEATRRAGAVVDARADRDGATRHDRRTAPTAQNPSAGADPKRLG